MKKLIFGYMVGVVTAPAVYYIFRDPLFKHVAMPVAMITVMDEGMNDKVFEVMTLRLDFQDFQKEHAKEIHQLKAQGYSLSEIAKKFDRKEVVIRGVLRNTQP